MIAISGIFYPISGLPGWLHPVAQVFPVYWLGLGTRAALSPDAAAAAEIGGSWRHLETFVVLGAVGGRRPGARAADPAPDGAARVGLGRRGAAPARDLQFGN